MVRDISTKTLAVSLLVAVVGGLVVSIVSEVELILRAVILDLIITIALAVYILSEPWNDDEESET
ncbi:MAG: hypothetical protein ABEJ07_04000 [Candidatus Nanohaloarchaea archaeon]